MSPSPPHPAQAQGLEQITSDIKHMAAVRKEKRREKKKVFQKRKTEWICQRAPSYNSPLPFVYFLSLAPFLSLSLFFPHHFLVTVERAETIVSTCLSSCQRHRRIHGLLMPFYPHYKVSVPLTGHEMKKEMEGDI